MLSQTGAKNKAKKYGMKKRMAIGKSYQNVVVAYVMLLKEFLEKEEKDWMWWEYFRGKMADVLSEHTRKGWGELSWAQFVALDNEIDRMREKGVE